VRQHKGNDKYSSLSAPADACYLRAAIGRDRIEAHDKALSTYTKELILESSSDAVGFIGRVSHCRTRRLPLRQRNSRT
jgi:hypothetical protein